MRTARASDQGPATIHGNCVGNYTHDWPCVSVKRLASWAMHSLAMRSLAMRSLACAARINRSLIDTCIRVSFFSASHPLDTTSVLHTTCLHTSCSGRHESRLPIVYHARLLGRACAQSETRPQHQIWMVVPRDGRSSLTNPKGTS